MKKFMISQIHLKIKSFKDIPGFPVLFRKTQKNVEPLHGCFGTVYYNYIAKSKCIVSLLRFFLFRFATIHSNSCKSFFVFFLNFTCFAEEVKYCKIHFYLKFQVPYKRSSDVVCFVEYPVYSNLELYSVLILVTFILISYRSSSIISSKLVLFSVQAQKIKIFSPKKFLIFSGNRTLQI